MRREETEKKKKIMKKEVIVVILKIKFEYININREEPRNQNNI